ncbi:MAG: hypothetical protein CM1200mP28_06800 [Deltaproteobacteria bacterium]|nr:MAG: hypothetical protein CM1200mP28_06800 [Deltaproteobacteria bacterium]
MAPLKKKGGGNNNGRITVRHRGGGHKRRYRIIDFVREKHDIPAKVATMEYDPNRSARISFCIMQMVKRDTSFLPGYKVGDVIFSGEKSDIKPGMLCL